MKVLVLALLLLWPPSTSSQAIPGVPRGCCGIRDCVPASVEFLRMENGWAVVSVNGKALRMPASAYSASPFGKSYYCFQQTDACKGPVVSDACARCAVEAAAR